MTEETHDDFPVLPSQLTVLDIELARQAMDFCLKHKFEPYDPFESDQEVLDFGAA